MKMLVVTALVALTLAGCALVKTNITQAPAQLPAAGAASDAGCKR